MKEIGYGIDYQYSHNFGNNFSEQEYLPEEISKSKFYEPGDNKRENEIRGRLKTLWRDKYGY